MVEASPFDSFFFIKYDPMHIWPLDCFATLYDESKTSSFDWYYKTELSSNQIIANKLALWCDIQKWDTLYKSV